MSNKFLNGVKVFGDINVKHGKLNFPNSSIADGKNGIYINNKIDGQNGIETGISLVSNGVAEYINAESHNVFSKTVGLPKCIINDIVYFDGKYIAATFSWTSQAYGIYYSYDGQHWQPSTLSTGRIQRFCVCDTEHGQILLAAYFAKGFKVSKDGINWTTTNTADASFDVSGKWGSVAFGNGLIVAGDDNGVYDGTTGTTTINKENALVYSTLTSAADGTFNAGAWTRVNIDGKGIHEVAFINNTWFVGTTAGLYITSSPAATFSTWRKVLESYAVFSIIFSEEANAYFIGTGDCVFKSTDLQSFTEVCGAADIIASGLVARTLACHDKFVIVGTEDGLQGLISDNYGEAGSWKRFAGFDENPTKANYKRIKFINGTFFLGNGSDADMDRCPESPIMFFDIDKVIATTADVERANKLTYAAIEQIEEAKSGLEDSIAEAVSTKADKSNVYTKSEIDSQNTAFLKKESSGIQTVSSDLALTGYVLIDNLAIDELNIESLSATSNVALSGGLTVTNGLVADSIKIGNDDVALAKNIPGIATSTVAGIAKYDGNGVTIESDGTVNLKLRTNHSGIEFENGGLYVQTSTTAHPTAGTVAPVATDTAGKLVVPDATSSAKGGVKLATSLDDTGAVSVTTASQVKTALAGKANSTHRHTTSEVDGLSEAITAATENKADKATTLAGYGITDAYTKSEIDSKNVEFLKKESSGIQTVSSDLALTGYVLIDNLSIDELEIESLTASSKVTLSGGLDVAGGLVADSIKVGNDAVALAKNIPNVSSFITKDVSNLTNYETKTVAEGKYAQKSTTLAGYGITDSYTKSEIDSKNVEFRKKGSSGIQTFSSEVALTGDVLIDNLSIDELEIESLTASSKVVLSGGLEVAGGITVDGKEVAAKSDIPNVSSFITKDVDNLTYYEKKVDAEKKYALVSSLSSYALKSDISNVYKYIGSVDTYSALPTGLTASDAGKVYNIVNADETNNISAGDNVAWTGSSWDKLGGSVDLSNYAQKATTLAGYGITDSYTKSEIDSKNVSFLTKESSGIQTVSSDLALTGYVLIDNLSIDELEIESLTASSKVTLSGGLEVSNGLVADSIKVGNDSVALAKNIPNVSSFITKDVNNLTNYETKETAEGKYAQKATTLAGYGITNAYTKTEIDELASDKADASTVYTKSEIDYKNVEFLKKESSGIQTVSSDLALTGYVLIDNLAIDELEIESLTASSLVTLSGGLSVSGGLVADSIKVGNDAVALAKNIPNVSTFITKDVSNLTNYETKTVAEAKYALKEEIPEVPTSAKYEIPAKPPTSNKIVWTITLDEEPDVAPIMQVFNKNGDVVYANITYVAGVITVVINSASACAEGDYYIIVSGQTGNSGYRTKVISNADFAQAALDNKIDLNTIYYIV